MAVNETIYTALKKDLDEKGITLVAVSKTKPLEDILALYNLGQRDFGENYVQELAEKQAVLPKDIRWHFIGHLQSNKVKVIAGFVHLIHGVDGFKLLKEINKQGIKSGRIIDCLLQIHIASEETKFGMDETELKAVIYKASDLQMRHVNITGMMGMASFTSDQEKVKAEFDYLYSLYQKYSNSLEPRMQFLSMGMSGDYTLAIESGSNMVRIGSLLFGAR